MTKEEMQELLAASENRIGMMMDVKLQAMESRIENTLEVELAQVYNKLDKMALSDKLMERNKKVYKELAK